MSWLCRKWAPLAWGMITCVVEYVIVPAKIDAFERFGRRWMELVDTHGGMHHGYFLMPEGAGRSRSSRRLDQPGLRSGPAVVWHLVHVLLGHAAAAVRAP